MYKHNVIISILLFSITAYSSDVHVLIVNPEIKNNDIVETETKKIVRPGENLEIKLPENWKCNINEEPAAKKINKLLTGKKIVCEKGDAIFSTYILCNPKILGSKNVFDLHKKEKNLPIQLQFSCALSKN